MTLVASAWKRLDVTSAHITLIKPSHMPTPNINGDGVGWGGEEDSPYCSGRHFRLTEQRVVMWNVDTGRTLVGSSDSIYPRFQDDTSGFWSLAKQKEAVDKETRQNKKQQWKQRASKLKPEANGRLDFYCKWKQWSLIKGQMLMEHLPAETLTWWVTVGLDRRVRTC